MMTHTDGTGRVVGVGFDIVDIRRLDIALARGTATFRRHVFTDHEWQFCAAAPDAAAALAERFAIKEAMLKALGTGWAERLALSEVSLAADARREGREVVLSGAAAARAEELGVTTIRASTSRVGDEAAAIVVLSG